MGASSGHKDIFIEVNTTWAEPGTSWGSATAPYSATEITRTDPNGHHHLPTPEVLKRVGDRYAAHGITAHFDVGDVAAYHALGVIPHSDWVDDYTSTVADNYLVPSAYASGGEQIREKACEFTTPEDCQFSAFPGTVGWKYGFSRYRNAPVGNNGEELTPQQLTDPNFDWGGRRRFDRVRYGLFHYILYAHALGKPKSLPCLRFGQPATYDTVDTNGNPACSVAPPRTLKGRTRTSTRWNTTSRRVLRASRIFQVAARW